MMWTHSASVCRLASAKLPVSPGTGGQEPSIDHNQVSGVRLQVAPGSSYLSPGSDFVMFWRTLKLFPFSCVWVGGVGSRSGGREMFEATSVAGAEGTWSTRIALLFAETQTPDYLTDKRGFTGT